MTAHPVMDLDVYLNPRFVAASVVAFMLGVGLFSSTYLVPLFVQTVQGYTPTASGLLLAPAGVVLGFVQPLGGRLSDRFPARVLIMIGIVFFGVSNFLMTDADTSTPFWRFAMWVTVGRVGMGLIMPALNSGALRVLDPRLVSHGAGAINFVRQLGGAVGVGLLSVYLERETTTYASEFNAMQTGGADAAQTLGRIAGALARAGLPDNPHVGARAARSPSLPLPHDRGAGERDGLPRELPIDRRRLLRRPRSRLLHEAAAASRAGRAKRRDRTRRRAQPSARGRFCGLVTAG